MSDLSTGGSMELEKESGEVPCGRKYGGGSPWRGILWDDCKCNFLLWFELFQCRSVCIWRRKEHIVFLWAASAFLAYLVCQSEKGLIWMFFSFLSRKALTRYQMLFRHMFYCKHVERQLCNVWISNKTAKQFSLHSAKWYGLFSCWVSCEALVFLVSMLVRYVMTWIRSFWQETDYYKFLTG